MNSELSLSRSFSFNNEGLLTGLPKSILEPIVKNKINIKVLAGESIFNEGETAKGVYRVKKGLVKKYTATNFGTEHIFYVCCADEYLGYHALLSKELYHDSAVALTPCELEFIPEQYFIEAIEASHMLTQRLLKNLSHEFVVFLNATKLLAKHTVRERAALNLLILEEKFRAEAHEFTEIVINRKDLASMVGTAKESIVRMLKDFKEDALITTSGRSIFIKNHAGLLKVASIN